MVSTVLQQVQSAPLNSAVMLLNSVIWFWMWNRRAGFEDVATSFRKVVLERQFYRVITATFTHLNLLHLVFNMASLYSIGAVETARGSYWYLQYTVLLIWTSEAVWMGITYLLLRFGRSAAMADSSAVGYSGVLFGWMTLVSIVQPGMGISFMGFSVPMAIAPWVSLVITQIIMPQASFMGHLSGIIAGYAAGWGLFAWLTDYWLWTSTAILCVVALLSLKANSNTGSLLTRFVGVSPDFMAHTGLGGSVAEVAAASDAQGAGGRLYMHGGVLRVERGLQAGDIEAGAPAAVATAPVAAGGAPAPQSARAEAGAATAAAAVRLPSQPSAPSAGAAAGVAARMRTLWQSVRGAGGRGQQGYDRLGQRGSGGRQQVGSGSGAAAGGEGEEDDTLLELDLEEGQGGASAGGGGTGAPRPSHAGATLPRDAARAAASPDTLRGPGGAAARPSAPPAHAGAAPLQRPAGSSSRPLP